MPAMWWICLGLVDMTLDFKETCATEGADGVQAGYPTMSKVALDSYIWTTDHSHVAVQSTHHAVRSLQMCLEQQTRKDRCQDRKTEKRIRKTDQDFDLVGPEDWK